MHQPKLPEIGSFADGELWLPFFLWPKGQLRELDLFLLVQNAIYNHKMLDFFFLLQKSSGQSVVPINS